ncbi:MAG: glutamate--tRNA ligase [Oscillospiraceae bacterium]|nr:glutamate--tRNA ligase [Oscillospiraceae bacterium]
MKKIRTRFAPSPTGFIHIGNLRSALYAYLIAKSQGGDFILRIEDTDQMRLVPNAEKIIYDVLKLANLRYDEGPDKPGEYGPYVQSQRKEIYHDKAFELIRNGGAYFCFCQKSDIAESKDKLHRGYDRKCRNLDENQVKKNLESGMKFVIRQKMPLEGKTSFTDTVFEQITIDNSELEDGILLKSDGMPTYNFANVIDDHMMHITHVVRGCEYLTSTPKYNLLYKAFGWEIPEYVHLPLIMGKNSDGSVTKLSKRAGSVGFEELIQDGFLPEVIVNYIAFLGWCPKTNREIFTLSELTKEFSTQRIRKSPAIFDYLKLAWLNNEYIKNKTPKEFAEIIKVYLKNNLFDAVKIAKILQSRVSKLSEIPELIDFIYEIPKFSKELFINKKSKTNFENALVILENALESLKEIQSWTNDKIYNTILQVAEKLNLKNSAIMWCIRISVSGKTVTPGGASEILDILGKIESINRIENALNMLKGIKG